MSASTSLELSSKLFVPRERWGWEYVAPAPISAGPDANNRPVWYEPPQPDVSGWLQQLQANKAVVPKRLGIALVVSVVGLAIHPALGLVLLGAGAFFGYIQPIVLLNKKIKDIWEGARLEREAAYANYAAVHAQWEARMGAHRQAEQLRHATANLWYPISLRSGPSRIDVFGGTAAGWASLLATLGTSLLGGGGMTVVDFTERHVAGGLAALAAGRGLRTSHVSLPGDQGLGLLPDLPSEELAELLSAAVHTMRPQGDNADLRALDAELLDTVLRGLSGPPTFRRVVAGLEVLRRVHELDGSPLTTAEVTTLTRAVDVVGQGDRAQQELRFLTSTLALLATEEPEGPQSGRFDLWAVGGLSIVSTTHRQRRRKDFLDRVLFQRLLHGVRDGEASQNTTLVVAGVDHIGLVSLEELAQECRRADVRLILLLDRLRGDAQQLLGSSDSAAVLMQLGNAQDASAAAEFIGKGHKMVLSQVTRQVGATFTEGSSRSEGGNEGYSSTEGTTVSTSSSTTRGSSDTDFKTTWSRSSTRGHSTSRQESFTESRSKTWQDTANVSRAASSTDGTTEARSYEFAVEPTTIQSLPPTAFVLVETPAGGRRVVLGDCNPGVCLLDRVALQPALV
ncbi:hypothetical protein [Actinokineospora globicatena]|uniref:hypothetical protein n=1 Tax=Actinokineospora globicatena TaxID=103729 RepID=UPI0020A34689|nr:hypothetical protein [Actinokineospora globicatena]MCP2304132.1 hypothetical protein [Actinokineospora globicatena]GLW78514.1 hypothetical protein Aglo01_29960 [Actinokineospora globicatena]GLW84822.1 hypothetical protein Aglo02_24620 [Actinokineospora globicatena]